MNTRIKMHVLLSIPWIGIGIASAIMAMHEPQLYGTIDSRSWAVLFYEETLAMNWHDALFVQTFTAKSMHRRILNLSNGCLTGST